ncbi:hypothetical protein D3C81_1352760 [compost metagenome]
MAFIAEDVQDVAVALCIAAIQVVADLQGVAIAAQSADYVDTLIAELHLPAIGLPAHLQRLLLLQMFQRDRPRRRPGQAPAIVDGPG